MKNDTHYAIYSSITGRQKYQKWEKGDTINLGPLQIGWLISDCLYLSSFFHFHSLDYSAHVSNLFWMHPCVSDPPPIYLLLCTSSFRSKVIKSVSI